MSDIKLSLRLETALSFAEGAVLADIGTDHARLAIAACRRGRAKRVIACDINPGPLAKAEENIRRCGLAERIETRLGGGFTRVAPGEADCAVIAGMGGMMIAGILKETPQTAKSLKRLVLQPQHDAPRLRKFLHENFYKILDEELVLDGGKYYFLIAAAPFNGIEIYEGIEIWSEAEYFYGKHILKKGGAALRGFLKKEAEKLAEYMKGGETDALVKRKALNRFALNLFENYE